MKVQINIPDYLSVSDWKYFNSLEHLSDTDKMIEMICHLGGKDREEIDKWKPVALTQVYAKLLESFQNLEPQFYPVFELDGQLYGFTPISKMTLGEYTDLERLAKDSNANLEEILAILYRPIEKHSFKGMKYAFKNTYKIALGQAENLFKYYETKEYNNKDRVIQAEKMKGIPAQMGLGALSFFLALGTLYSINSQVSSLPNKRKKMVMEKVQEEMDSLNIGAGLLQFITSLELPSLISQERKRSLISISSLYLTSWPLNRIRQREKNKLESYKKELIELDNEII